MSLLDACARFYGLTGYALRPLAGGVTEHTFLLEHQSAPTRVLRVAENGAGAMAANEDVLLFLEDQDYPAPRVIRALDGSPAVVFEGKRLVLTTYLDGEIVDYQANTPASLRGIGRAIGRLHALTPPDLAVADFMPVNRIPDAESGLLAVAERVPVDARRRFDELIGSLQSTPTFAAVPSCLIHNDCHPGNAVLRPDGEVAMIDWDGAGAGHPCLDLGFLLVAADTYTPDVPAIGESDERVHAIVDGYCDYRTPSDAELALLAEAICYRVTLINSFGFIRLVERREAEKIEEWWWHGCEMAESLAERVRRRVKAEDR